MSIEHWIVENAMQLTSPSGLIRANREEHEPATDEEDSARLQQEVIIHRQRPRLSQLWQVESIPQPRRKGSIAQDRRGFTPSLEG